MIVETNIILDVEYASIRQVLPSLTRPRPAEPKRGADMPDQYLVLDALRCLFFMYLPRYLRRQQFIDSLACQVKYLPTQQQHKIFAHMQSVAIGTTCSSLVRDYSS